MMKRVEDFKMAMRLFLFPLPLLFLTFHPPNDQVSLVRSTCDSQYGFLVTWCGKDSSRG